MADREEPLSNWLEVITYLAVLGGVVAAGAGLLLNSLPLAAGAFLFGCLGVMVPQEISLRQCRRNLENCQPCRGDPEPIADGLQAEEIGRADDQRFQMLVAGQGKGIGIGGRR